MSAEAKVLAIITARGNSKGVPRKNLREIRGKSLLSYTIGAAKQAQLLDRIVLSSEDDEIIAEANKLGCEVPFKRPVELSLDITPGVAPVLYTLERLQGYDYVVLLQPTSPLRSAEDIDGCVAKCIESGAPACVSVVEVEKHPVWMFRANKQQCLKPFVSSAVPVRRQDCEPLVVLNGAVYVAAVDWLLKNRNFISQDTVYYLMPKERSLDIDTEDDMKFCETFLQLQ